MEDSIYGRETQLSNNISNNIKLFKMIKMIYGPPLLLCLSLFKWKTPFLWRNGEDPNSISGGAIINFTGPNIKI